MSGSKKRERQFFNDGTVCVFFPPSMKEHADKLIEFGKFVRKHSDLIDDSELLKMELSSAVNFFMRDWRHTTPKRLEEVWPNYAKLSDSFMSVVRYDVGRKLGINEPRKTSISGTQLRGIYTKRGEELMEKFVTSHKSFFTEDELNVFNDALRALSQRNGLQYYTYVKLELKDIVLKIQKGIREYELNYTRKLANCCTYKEFAY